MTLHGDSIPKAAPWAATVEVDGDTVLLARTTGALHLLNDEGAAIWSRVDGSRTVSTIAAELSEVSGVEADDVRHDVYQFIARLERLGLLNFADGGNSRGGAELECLEAFADRGELPGEAPRTARFGIDAVWVDWYTAQVVDALRMRGIEAILLKGPTIRRWLYRDAPEQRGYLDADLLVAAANMAAAAAALCELGYEREQSRVRKAVTWADTWRRAADGAVVDLHRTLQGCQYSTVDPWPILRATAVEDEVGGTTVLVPSIPARATQVVLVSPTDTPWRKWDDLPRLLDQFPVDGWRQAAKVAKALGVERLFGYRLSQSPAGAACAEHIGASAAPAWWLRWEREWQGDPVLRWAGWLTVLPDWRARLRLARNVIIPPISYVRLRDPDTDGRGFLSSYADWMIYGMRLLPPAALTLLRSMRAGT